MHEQFRYEKSEIQSFFWAGTGDFGSERKHSFGFFFNFLLGKTLAQNEKIPIGIFPVLEILIFTIFCGILK